ncbi:MAG: site-2 protease family protein [Nitrospirota bacterium]
MDILITIIVFILVFSILILVHEFGHFWMAKRAGIEVKEFGIGLPPRIWGWRRKKKKGQREEGTLYSLNWIPFGGFVRMLGEDATDPSMMRKKRSFIAQPMRSRVKVIIAGVVMNFLLAWILLTVGFTVGMQPLLTPEDVLPAVSNGVIELTEGLKLKNVEEGSFASELGFQAEDVIFSVNDNVLDDFLFAEMLEDPVGKYKVMRGDKVFTYEIVPEQLPENMEGFAFGFEFYDYVSFPRVRVFDVNEGGKAYKAGLRPGDFVISVNGEQVYSVIEFEDIVRGVNVQEFEVYRNGFNESFILEYEQFRKVVISSVIPGSPAEVAGFESGDVIVSVNGENVYDSVELISYVEEHGGEVLAYSIERGGERMFYEVKPEEGKIGVYLSELMQYGEEQDVSLYNTNLFSSVVKINDEQYPWYIAIYESFGEGFRLAKITGKMFVEMVGTILRSGEVPDSVAGPVGIASLTHIFIQEGFISMLRFIAILSLSLAVINILPFPALDGGRLLFILIEFVMGRRVNQKWEAYIHALGYILILLLIFIITYSDIARLI